MKHRSIVILNQDSATVRMPRDYRQSGQQRTPHRYCVVEERFAHRLKSPRMDAVGQTPAYPSNR